MKNEYLKTITIKIVRMQDRDPTFRGFWRSEVDDGDVVIRDDTEDFNGKGDFHSFLLSLECAKARAIQIVGK